PRPQTSTTQTSTTQTSRTQSWFKRNQEFLLLIVCMGVAIIVFSFGITLMKDAMKQKDNATFILDHSVTRTCTLFPSEKLVYVNGRGYLRILLHERFSDVNATAIST